MEAPVGHGGDRWAGGDQVGLVVTRWAGGDRWLARWVLGLGRYRERVSGVLGPSGLRVSTAGTGGLPKGCLPDGADREHRSHDYRPLTAGGHRYNLRSGWPTLR